MKPLRAQFGIRMQCLPSWRFRPAVKALGCTNVCSLHSMNPCDDILWGLISYIQSHVPPHLMKTTFRETYTSKNWAFHLPKPFEMAFSLIQQHREQKVDFQLSSSVSMPLPSSSCAAAVKPNICIFGVPVIQANNIIYIYMYTYMYLIINTHIYCTFSLGMH